MKDFIADYGTAICSIVIVIYSAYLDYKRNSGSYRWFNGKIIFIAFMGLLTLFCTYFNVSATKDEKLQSNNTINSLRNKASLTLTTLQNLKTAQSKFEKVLFDKFHIVRDSTNNIPKRVSTYNTNIGTAGTVNIGTN